MPDMESVFALKPQQSLRRMPAVIPPFLKRVDDETEYAYPFTVLLWQYRNDMIPAFKLGRNQMPLVKKKTYIMGKKPIREVEDVKIEVETEPERQEVSGKEAGPKEEISYAGTEKEIVVEPEVVISTRINNGKQSKRPKPLHLKRD